jgi:4-hydroxybenzoate polyprenyltransferase
MMGSRQQVRAYLQLVRLPAVFTAMADIVLGFVLVHGWLSPLGEFTALLSASTALYLAGMALNDFFDRRVDAIERPNRPIPSGRISPRVAFAVGVVLFAIGLSSSVAAGRFAVAVAVGLTVLILAYDGLLKATFAGPIAMGGCRFLNVLLGASGAGFSGWESPPIGVAAAMGIYVAGITCFARREAATSSRAQLVGAALVIHSGVGLLLLLPLAGWLPSGLDSLAFALLLPVIAFIDFGLAPALARPTPVKVQAGVKRLLLAIVLLDATTIYWVTGNGALACGTALLIVPAATLGRWIFIT